MNKNLQKELLYGGRALVRDNWISQRLLNQLLQHEKLTPEQMQAKAQRYLHQSMQKAIAKLPFYADISPKFGIADAPHILREQFAVIDKATLLANRSTLYPRGGMRMPWESLGMTSGTTGTPLTVFRSLRAVLLEQAFLKRHWVWGGYVEGMKRVTLRGDVVVPLLQEKPPFWFWNRYNQQLVVSSRHLLDHCVDAIIAEIAALEPYMLQAYPSTAYTLAQFLQRRGKFLKIPLLFCASEPLYPHQRQLIVERIGCKVMDMYSMAERVVYASQCEHGQMHVNPDYSHVEILDENDQPTDGEGFIVGTTFHNFAMPLIRYRVSDRTRWKKGTCVCGRPFPMIEAVSGKFEDFITGSNGAPVSPSVLTFALKGVEHIKKTQVAQVAAAHWQIRVVPMPGFTMLDERKLIDNIHQLVDPGVQVEVVLKTDLPNTAAGKFRWVVNESRE